MMNERMHEYEYEWWYQRVTVLHASEFDMISLYLVEFHSIQVSSASTEAVGFALLKA